MRIQDLRVDHSHLRPPEEEHLASSFRARNSALVPAGPAPCAASLAPELHGQFTDMSLDSSADLTIANFNSAKMLHAPKMVLTEKSNLLSCRVSLPNTLQLSRFVAVNRIFFCERIAPQICEQNS